MELLIYANYNIGLSTWLIRYRMLHAAHVTSLPAGICRFMMTSSNGNTTRYWPFVRGIHRSPVNSPHKGQLRGALMFSFICVWTNGWANNRKAGDLRGHRAHYGVIVMFYLDRGGQSLFHITKNHILFHLTKMIFSTFFSQVLPLFATLCSWGPNM